LLRPINLIMDSSVLTALKHRALQAGELGRGSTGLLCHHGGWC